MIGAVNSDTSGIAMVAQEPRPAEFRPDSQDIRSIFPDLVITSCIFDKSISNMQEVMPRSGKILLISCESGLNSAGRGSWATITMPDVSEFTAPIIYAVPMQLLAYHTALAKGTDADQPRNLAKSVTVE